MYDDRFTIIYRAFSKSEGRVIQFDKGQIYNSHYAAERFLRENFKAHYVEGTGVWIINEDNHWKIEDDEHINDYEWVTAIVKMN